MMMIRQAFPFFHGSPGICSILPKIFTLFRGNCVIFPSPFLLGRFFSTYAFTRSHGLCLLLHKPHHPPPPTNTLDCSLSILGCQNMRKRRRKSMITRTLANSNQFPLDFRHLHFSAVARPNGQPRQAGVARGGSGACLSPPPPEKF